MEKEQNKYTQPLACYFLAGCSHKLCVIAIQSLLMCVRAFPCLSVCVCVWAFFYLLNLIHFNLQIGFNAGNGTQAYEYKPYSQASVLRDLTGRGWANGFPGRHIFRIDEKIMLGTCNKDIGMVLVWFSVMHNVYPFYSMRNGLPATLSISQFLH